MQPSPMAETSKLLFPSLRFCIFELLSGRDHQPATRRLLSESCGTCRILAGKQWALVRKHGYLYPRACALWAPGRSGICVGAYTSVRRKYLSEVARTSVANFERDFR